MDKEAEIKSKASGDRSPGFDALFKTDHLKSDLKGHSVRGASVTVFAQTLRFVMTTGSTAIIARLLTPHEYGIIAMVWSIVAFAFLFKDIGLSMAIIQKEKITHSQVNNLFWINVGFGAVVTIFFITLSPVIAWFYGKEELKLITITLAFSYMFAGFTAQHQGLLKRQMRFTALAVNELVAIMMGVLCAIIAAWLGAGYWALVLKELVTSLFRALIVWRLCKWRPGLPGRGGNIISMLAFGGNLSGFNILNYFARNFDKVLIGRFLDSNALGFYSKAYNLLLLPINQINVPIANVAIPSLSRLQHEPKNYCRYYCRTINIASFLTMPLVVILAVLANEIILILLGDQWGEAAVLFQILAIAAFGQTVSQTTGWIFVSLGQTDRMFKWAVFSVPIIIFSFMAGLPWGVRGVAISYTICDHLLRIPLFIYAFKQSPIKIFDLLSAVWRPLVISLVMAIVLSTVHYYIRSLNVFLIISIISLSGLAVMGLSALFLPGAKSEFNNIKEIVQLLIAKRQARPSAS